MATATQAPRKAKTSTGSGTRAFLLAPSTSDAHAASRESFVAWLVDIVGYGQRPDSDPAAVARLLDRIASNVTIFREGMLVLAGRYQLTWRPARMDRADSAILCTVAR